MKKKITIWKFWKSNTLYLMAAPRHQAYQFHVGIASRVTVFSFLDQQHSYPSDPIWDDTDCSVYCAIPTIKLYCMVLGKGIYNIQQITSLWFHIYEYLLIYHSIWFLFESSFLQRWVVCRNIQWFIYEMVDKYWHRLGFALGRKLVFCLIPFIHICKPT